jgi:hypothetical protein
MSVLDGGIGAKIWGRYRPADAAPDLVPGQVYEIVAAPSPIFRVWLEKIKIRSIVNG